VQGTYAGARPGGGQGAQARVADRRPAAPASVPKPGTAGRSVAAANPEVASRAAKVDRGLATQVAQSRPAAASTASSVDRNRATQVEQQRPAAASRSTPAATKTAVSSVNHGGSDREASARGRQSASKGVPAKAKGGKARGKRG
jgi:hypothetical protein